MAQQKLSDFSNEEFRQMLENLVEDDATDLPVSKFFEALAAIDAETPRKTVELQATVKDGMLTFIEPAPLFAHDNEIHFGPHRVVITHVSEAV
jgi:hypothetical protein